MDIFDGCRQNKEYDSEKLHHTGNLITIKDPRIFAVYRYPMMMN